MKRTSQRKLEKSSLKESSDWGLSQNKSRRPNSEISELSLSVLLQMGFSHSSGKSLAGFQTNLSSLFFWEKQ